MKYCPHCGAAQEVSAAVFCPECGRGPSPAARHPKAPAEKRKHRLPDDYDGYYRDTPVADGGQIRTGLDPVMTKKIVWLALGVVLVVALAVLSMRYL